MGVLLKSKVHIVLAVKERCDCNDDDPDEDSNSPTNQHSFGDMTDELAEFFFGNRWKFFSHIAKYVSEPQ